MKFTNITSVKVRRNKQDKYRKLINLCDAISVSEPESPSLRARYLNDFG